MDFHGVYAARLLTYLLTEALICNLILDTILFNSTIFDVNICYTIESNIYLKIAFPFSLMITKELYRV